MKTIDKKSIINGLEQILANGVMECEEIDVTAEKIYSTYIRPLKLALDNENQNGERNQVRNISL